MEKDKLNEAIVAAKATLEGDDIAAIKSATEALLEVAQGISAHIYQAGAADQQAEGGDPAQGDEPAADAGDEEEESKKEEGPIIDAEVVDEKKD